jgi:hypothetical protein
VYSVETDAEVLPQIEALPAGALAAYAEVMTLLEVAPWSGDAYNRMRPEANMRSMPFGEHGAGLVTYLVVEDQRLVSVLRVLWAG